MLDASTATKSDLLAYWNQKKDEGVTFYLDGEEVSPDVLCEKCVWEKSPYMADYVFEAGGKITQIRMDYVRVKSGKRK